MTAELNSQQQQEQKGNDMQLDASLLLPAARALVFLLTAVKHQY